MHLAWRWFTGLRFDQEIPHSLDILQEPARAVSEVEVVLSSCLSRSCGSVLRRVWYRASICRWMAASWKRMQPRRVIFRESSWRRQPRRTIPCASICRKWKSRTFVEEPVYEQDQVSTTDPDSTYSTKGGTPARLGYNYLVDKDCCVGVQATARMSQDPSPRKVC
jgi:hypothetical protein